MNSTNVESGNGYPNFETVRHAHEIGIAKQHVSRAVPELQSGNPVDGVEAAAARRLSFRGRTAAFRVGRAHRFNQLAYVVFYGKHLRYRVRMRASIARSDGRQFGLRSPPGHATDGGGDVFRRRRDVRLHIIAVHSGHFSQLEGPDLVIDAVHDVLTGQEAAALSGQFLA